MDCSPPGSSVHGNSPGNPPGWAAVPSSKGSYQPPGKPKNTGVGGISLFQGIFLTQESSLGSPALQVDSLLTEPPGKLRFMLRTCQGQSCIPRGKRAPLRFPTNKMNSVVWRIQPKDPISLFLWLVSEKPVPYILISSRDSAPLLMINTVENLPSSKGFQKITPRDISRPGTTINTGGKNQPKAINWPWIRDWEFRNCKRGQDSECNRMYLKQNKAKQHRTRS